MKKLISIGLIVATLAVIVVPALTSGMPTDPIPPVPPARLLYFGIDWSGASIDGRIKAIEGNDRELELRITAECSNDNHKIIDLQLVVALWSEGNPVLYRTYHHQEYITTSVGEWTYTLSVKEDGIIGSPKYGLVYVRAEVPWSWKFKTYAIKFINDAQPMIYPYPYNIPGRWSMYQQFQDFPDYYG